jgi:hypothetical protein
MAGSLRQLKQRRCGAATGLSTLAAAEPARQIVHEGGRRVVKGGQVNVPFGSAP